ncbi:RapZ C-terminal domain-containing protein [Arachidicoccus sp.]|uniref:RapZ C-terminal domain-containing protein n=1 Tax=Arachidicoccus sp. TaxID=1872624 RepID=UPI003D1E3243
MITEQIEQLFANYSSEKIDRIEKVPQSGSSRQYFRIFSGDRTYIATYNLNGKENDAFIAFTLHFKKLNLPVPSIYAVSDNSLLYLQEDLGAQSLLNILEEKGHCDEVYALFKQALKQLAKLQIKGHVNFNYDLCLTAREFGKQAIQSDLLYFKYYFLDTLGFPYDKQALLNEFEALGIFLTQNKYKYFMFRDFQSRNIMVKNNEVFFIDYQGGMHGALQYDVASLLWQAKAGLSDKWKTSLLDYYTDEVSALLKTPIDKESFNSQYKGYVLIRLLQVLGAYGFRGLFERKAHFLTSIPFALNNLKWFVENRSIGIDLPEFEKILHYLVSEETIQRFTPIKAKDNTPLTIEVNSFSYREGIPKDETNNGGGFVFDCRGILNPGRIEEYKRLSGLDKPVQDFLEQSTEMNRYLNSVFDLIDISMENYITRGFENLQINFGCTGGQHRSVYAATQTARHLRNKYNVNVMLHHTNKRNWVK